MTLATLFRATSLLQHQQRIIELQEKKIALLEADLIRVHLEYNRELRALVSSWLINLETPEVDMRPDLAQLDVALGNRVAELEEHVL